MCVPCPAMDPCAPTAGVKSGPQDGTPHGGKQEDPCPCRTCCCGKPPIVKPCYKQPRIPDSYAPRRCYVKPTARVENGTTYNMSYLPVDGCKNLRGVARKPAPNLVPSCEPMESCTVQKLSFLPNPVCQTQPIRPCHHDMWGQGPMQNLTTQRHDYVPKPCVLRESCKPPPKFHCVETPFENRTINKLSYLPPERMEITKSYAPERCYEKPAAKMDGTTTHKMSYMPNQIMPKEPVPWACKGQYQKPCQALDINTTYTMSFLDAKSDCRRRAIMPNTCNNPVTASKRFETQTIYKNSYQPAKAPIPAPVRPLPNLVPSTAQMEGDTVQKLSFLPNPVCVTQAIRPCHHDMWGQGPMQNLTTQRHDYVPKPVVPTLSCKPPAKFHCVEQPFENRTVNRMSYLNPGRIPPPESYAPNKCYEKPSVNRTALSQSIEEYSTSSDGWEKVADITGASQENCKIMFQTITKEADKKKIKKKKNIMGTDGGPPLKYVDDPLLDKVKGLVGPSIEGLYTIYDGDSSIMDAKMESETTQKMSYQPVCVPTPQKPPWACKGQYQKPCQRLESTTVYRSSFLPPGEDCTEYMDPCSYGDCKPCDCNCPAECIATDPCACNFPRAACCS